MLINFRHGRHPAPERGATASRFMEAAAPAALMAAAGAPAGTADPVAPGGFRYFFPDAPVPEHDQRTTAALDALADAMIEPPEAGDLDSRIPAIFTYLGQFIDHDITAGTDREDGLSRIGGNDVVPLPRDKVVRDRLNLRAGSLGLDSVYGDGPSDSELARRLAAALRHPVLRAKMWLGTFTDAGLGRVPLPVDPAGDLLRLGRLLREPHKLLDESELRAMPEALSGGFVNDDGSIRVQRAIIGDSRNDENLIVAQLHLAFLRFHNRVVDVAHQFGGPSADPDELYSWAQRMVRWTYQWLVLNVYLKTVCDPAVVRDVLARGAPLYGEFFRRHETGQAAHMPMPLEFSVAAFRFGHTMVRPTYDWNRFFGEPADGQGPLVTRASLKLLFAFTGNGPHPMAPGPDQPSLPTLPGHWGAEWDRLANPVTDVHPDRGARKIDTQLAPPLRTMPNEDGIPADIFGMLARRNLRRGHLLSIPSAQDCIAGLYARTGTAIEPLGADELTSGRTGAAVRDGGFVSRTPLWFYVLREAECRAGGETLGPLGSRLVAETLAGLVINDPGSYWHQPGSDGGRWHPRDGARPAGEVVDSIPALLRAALVM